MGWMSGRASRIVLMSVVTVWLAACTGVPANPPASRDPAADRHSPSLTLQPVEWTPLAPVPGATTLHWVTSVGAEVLVSGQRGTGVQAPPGLWLGDGGGRWHNVDLAPATYYGHRAVLFRIASDGRRVVALGRRIGGTHGNPRFTSWTGTPAALHETEQPFELFGGPDAIGVTDLAMTAGGGVVLGSWSHHGDPAGVAVWRQDGDTWQRFDRAPGLASEVTDVGSELTTPAAVTSRAGEPVLVGWTVHLGGGHVGLRPSLWLPAGSAWHEVRLPAGGDDAQARAVTCGRPACVVAGAESGRLAVWLLRGETVERVRVPTLAVGEREPVFAVTGRTAVWLALGTGRTSHLVRLRLDDGGRVRDVAPVSPPAGRVVSMTAAGDAVVAVVEGADGATRLERAAG
jgi:hypothetical protein